MLIWDIIVNIIFERLINSVIEEHSSVSHWLYFWFIKLYSFKGIFSFEVSSANKFEISFVNIKQRVHMAIWEKVVLTHVWKFFFEKEPNDCNNCPVNEFSISLSIVLYKFPK